jgi:hypothetical protein
MAIDGDAGVAGRLIVVTDGVPVPPISRAVQDVANNKRHQQQ